MRTDRELLELAAKAAGYDATYTEWYDVDNGACAAFMVPNSGGWGKNVWNPLTNDGDALRLAVKLRLDICTEDNDPHPIENRQISHVNVWPFDGCVGSSEDLGNDPYAATRRAIVRAAAEIGKGIKQCIVGDVPEDNYYKTQAEADEAGHSSEIGKSK